MDPQRFQYFRRSAFPSWSWSGSPVSSPPRISWSSRPPALGSTPSAFSLAETEGAPRVRPLPGQTTLFHHSGFFSSSQWLPSESFLPSPPPTPSVWSLLSVSSAGWWPSGKASRLFSSHCAHSPRERPAHGRRFMGLGGRCWVTPSALACLAASPLSDLALPFPRSLPACHKAHLCSWRHLARFCEE